MLAPTKMHPNPLSRQPAGQGPTRCRLRTVVRCIAILSLLRRTTGSIDDWNRGRVLETQLSGRNSDLYCYNTATILQ